MLATESPNPLFDDTYRNLFEQEMLAIMDNCESTSDQYVGGSLGFESPNMGKVAVDAFYGRIELASGTQLPVLTSLLNSIFSIRKLADSFKLGWLTPVFKNERFQRGLLE